MLYSKDGGYPTNLPSRIRLSDGRTRTDSSTFTLAEIQDAGYIEVADKPVIDENLQKLSWDSENLIWVTTDLTQEELDAIALQAFMRVFNTWKSSRAEAVNDIEVTYNSVIYQGDETSQNRMTRSIIALPDDITTIEWTAKDNTQHSLTRIDLATILALAGNAQAALWSTGRPVLV